MTDAQVEVRHVVPWRVHLRSRALVGQRQACEATAERLANEIDFDSISVRPLTGSVVVVRMGGNLDAEAIRRRLVELIALGRTAEGRPLADERRRLEGNTRVARAVASAVRTLNDRVREALDSEADLKILVPIALATASMLQPALTGRLSGPPWSQLLWYSLRSFMTLNREAIDTDAETRPAAAPGDPASTPAPPASRPV